MGEASKTRSRLARDQWNDYLDRFGVFEKRMKNLALEGPGSMVNRARSNASSQFDQGLDTAQRQQSRYGMQTEFDSRERRANAQSGALAKVDAANSARDSYERQQLGLMTGNYRERATGDTD